MILNDARIFLMTFPGLRSPTGFVTMNGTMNVSILSASALSAKGPLLQKSRIGRKYDWSRFFAR